MKVMIVDDNPYVREIIRESFPSTDAVVECSDGSEAVSLYSKMLPDWVVMDIVMSPMNGFDALKLILNLHPDARVIMMTQSKDALYREKALNIGAIEFISKEELTRIEEIIQFFGQQ